MKNGIEIDEDGNKRWYKDDNLHREDGPAIEGKYGSKYWCIEGKLHREDGPAVEYKKGNKRWSSWYIEGIQLSKDQFDHILAKKRLTKLQGQK
jgi:hypothetical protein